MFFALILGVFKEVLGNSEYTKPNDIMINGYMNWRGRGLL